MMALFLFIIFGLVFSYFATLNTSTVAIYFGFTRWEHLPLYLVILGSLAIGISFASLFYFVHSFFSRRKFGKKEREFEDLTRENMALTRKNHQLELENTRMKAQNGEEDVDDNSL